MSQEQKIKQLTAEKEALENDINELAEFIFMTFKSMGVKSFADLDKVGNTVLKEVPKIMTESMMFPQRLRKRFMHFDSAQQLLDKYQHLIPKD